MPGVQQSKVCPISGFVNRTTRNSISPAILVLARKSHSEDGEPRYPPFPGKPQYRICTYIQCCMYVHWTACKLLLIKSLNPSRTTAACGVLRSCAATTRNLGVAIVYRIHYENSLAPLFMYHSSFVPHRLLLRLTCQSHLMRRSWCDSLPVAATPCLRMLGSLHID